MKILVDADDTFWDFMNPVLNHLNKKYHLNIKKDEIKTWTWLSDTYGFNNPFACTECAEFWNKVIPFENAIKVINQLVKEGHEVYFVTASGFTNGLAPKIHRLLSFFDDDVINDSNIIIAKDKHMISGNVLIDDGPHNLAKTYANTIQYYQPWNESCNCGHFIAKDWSIVYEYVKWFDQILNI